MQYTDGESFVIYPILTEVSDDRDEEIIQDDGSHASSDEDWRDY